MSRPGMDPIWRHGQGTPMELKAYADGYLDGRKDVLVGLDNLRTEQKKAVADKDKEFDIQPGQNIGRLGRVLLDRMSRLERHLGLEAGALKTSEGYLPTAPSPAPLPRPPKPPVPKYEAQGTPQVKGNPLDYVTPLKTGGSHDE